MLFSSMVFIFAFLPVLCILYFAVPYRTYRNVLLCAASLLFYAWGEPRYILLMAASILVNYLAGMLVGQEDRSGLRKLYLFLAVVINIAALGFFKYAGFLVRNINAVCGTHCAVPDLPLPIGISFYTFQAMSYVIDVYRRKAAAQKNPVSLTLYITLFPQLIAGPIVRYTDIEREITVRKETSSGFIRGLQQFITGLAAKVIIANNMAVIADGIFADYASAGTAALWIAALAYTFQIYFDFAGYSRMAIGLGMMFGFTFPENFNYPYMSCSITEFWRRWHMTLSSWFRDYVYIPLGGSRCTRIKLIRNILITWMLTGFWHGAEWNFVLWGLYYAILLLIEKLFSGRYTEQLPKPVMCAVTFFLVVIGWMLFRITDMHMLKDIMIRMFTPSGTAFSAYVAMHADTFSKSVFFIPAVLASFPVTARLHARLYEYTEHHDCTAVLYAGDLLASFLLFTASVCLLVASTYNPFIYFRF